MARKVVFRAAAERDLAKLYRDIRDQRGAPIVAIDYIRRIRAYCEGFAEFPERRTKRDDIRPGLRVIGFERRVVIAFTFDDHHVRIARIFYGGRDYEALVGRSEP
ncbi:type II toxin-antitoxin system RelE/ParE family toxin [Methylosinus sp. Sm6]|uniref:type II toxin-antitoxin system RelE/ParE family toxin n=1 Tax=Methylosinus sp. Sm6 TaxID=2866948 RepID=UPI001C99451B|nr:type II toxin-antitoxin system RelE/ParE family toxin [Methylosinus sp. Sm6]